MVIYPILYVNRPIPYNQSTINWGTHSCEESLVTKCMQVSSRGAEVKCRRKAKGPLCLSFEKLFWH